MQEEKRGYSRYISRIHNHDSIDDLSLIIREFLKEVLHIKYELTFKEIESILKPKHIPDEIKQKIAVLCEKFETLEYRPKKPSKSEISSIKNLSRDIIRDFSPKKEEVHQFSFFDGIKKKDRDYQKEKR